MSAHTMQGHTHLDFVTLLNTTPLLLFPALHLRLHLLALPLKRSLELPSRARKHPTYASAHMNTHSLARSASLMMRSSFSFCCCSLASAKSSYIFFFFSASCLCFSRSLFAQRVRTARYHRLRICLTSCRGSPDISWREWRPAQPACPLPFLGGS